MAAKYDQGLRRLSESDLFVRPEEDVRGRTALDHAGEKIGEVEDLIVDERDAKVRFLRVASGGFLGIGESTFLVPVDAVTSVTQDAIRIDRSREHVAGAPRYDPDVIDERQYYESLYDHYKYTPYWSAGYQYPSYPLYAAHTGSPFFP